MELAQHLDGGAAGLTDPSSAKPAILFRTHFWNADVERAWTRLRAGSAHDIWVCADETRGSLPVPAALPKLPHHVERFRSMGLRCVPDDKVLWYNGDYPLYSAAQDLPHDAFVMIEYDTYFGAGLDDLIAKWHRAGIDFVAPRLERRKPDWHWHRTVKRAHNVELRRGGSPFAQPPPVFGMLFPFLYISRRAVDFLLQRRLTISRTLADVPVAGWPYCEGFVATELVAAGFKVSALEKHADIERLDHLKPIHVDEVALLGPVVAHPVLSGADYVSKLLLHAGIRSRRAYAARRESLASQLGHEPQSVIAIALKRLNP